MGIQLSVQMKTYSEKLRDPRWQKKRLGVLERDGFTCVRCKDKDSPLHVHHAFYEKGLAPWEYDDSTLVTFCEKCHSDAEYVKKHCGLLIIDPLGMEIADNVLRLCVADKNGIATLLEWLVQTNSRVVKFRADEAKK